MRPNRLPITVLSLLALLSPGTGEAQCLTEAERPTFERLLRERLGNSELPVPDLFRHAQDRLGYGPNPRQVGALPPPGSQAAQLDDLAARVASSLSRAAQVRAGLERALAALPRETVPADLPELSPNVFRHVAGGMQEAYGEIDAANRQIQAVLAELATLPPGPARDQLLAELTRLRRLRSFLSVDLRESASARVEVLALQAEPVDLGATLSEFWSNHFNVDAAKSEWSAIAYRRTIQGALCGSFRGLLTQVAKHPAMLVYLDNYRSRRAAINENYARELMELHTFGDDQFRFYDQDDVVDVARVLTGWSIQFETLPQGGVRPAFAFFPGAHDGAAVRLFDGAPQGRPLDIAAASGPAAISRGEQLLGYLAGHPATRNNICTKLARWLLGTAPTPVVQGCASAAVWGTDGDLGAVYRYLLTTRELWTSTRDLGAASAAALPKLYGAMQKTPLELVISAQRAVGQPVAGTLGERWLKGLTAQIGQLGLRVARTPPPTGYPIGRAWLSSGLVVGFQQYLFSQLPTTSLFTRLGSQVLRGPELEAYYQDQVQDAFGDPDANQQLAQIAASVAADVLAVPGAVPVSTPGKLGSLVDSDAATSGGARAPVRSYVHALLGSWRFARK